MRNREILFILFFLLLFNLSNAQVKFQKLFLTSWNKSIKQTSDGNYILAGGTIVPTLSEGMTLTKINTLGDTLWTRIFADTAGNNSDSWANSVIQTFDNGYLVTGFTEDFNSVDFDMYVIRTDSVGDTLWTRTFGHPVNAHDYGFSALQTNDSNFIVFGRQGSFNVDFYLNKLSATGSILWSKSYSIASNHDFGNYIFQTADKGFIMGGTTKVGTISKMLVIKADSIGSYQWAKTYGDSGISEYNTIRPTYDGGYLIAGTTLQFGAGGNDIFIIKTNVVGDTLWSCTYGTSNFDECYSFQQTPDSGFIITGVTYFTSPSSFKMYLLKIDMFGNIIWSYTYKPPPYNVKGYDVITTNDGGYLASGEGGYTVKTDSSGDSGCNQSPIVFSVQKPSFQVASVIPSITTHSQIRFPNTLFRRGYNVSNYCIFTGLEHISFSHQVSVYPNPAMNELNIRFTNINYTGIISIYNILGENIFECSLINQFALSIDIHSFSCGIYFIKFQNETETTVKKLIKG